MKVNLYNMKKELEFEIKDKKLEVGELKQEIQDLEYQVNDYRSLAKVKEDQSSNDREHLNECKVKLDKANKAFAIRSDELNYERD